MLVAVPRFLPAESNRHSPKLIYGGRLFAEVPSRVRVEPLPDDREPLDYDLTLDLDIVDGRMQCVSLCAVQRPSGPAVTTENLRRVPVGQIVSFAAHELRLVREAVPSSSDPNKMVPAASWDPPAADFAAGGMTDAALESMARIYRMTMATGNRPYGVLEREFNLARAKASRWVSVAKRRGILEDDPDGS